MPLPQVVFNKDSSAEVRSQALLHLEQWLDSGGVSAVKKQVMRAVINYAKRKLVEPGPFSFTDPTHFTTCETVFNQRELSDLLFLQQVVHRLNAIRDETSELKKAVLPLALSYKRPLLLPLVRQMEKASFGLSIAALDPKNIEWILLARTPFFISELTAEAKVEWLLNDCLKQPAESGRTIYLDDCFEVLSQLANRECKRALGFFNRVLQTNEQTDSFDFNPEMNKRKLK